MALNDYEMDRRLEELTGRRCVYPGHPLVIGFAIMCSFESLAAASKKQPGCPYKPALVSNSVPGAGSHVHKALDLLQLVEKSLIGVADLPERADIEWLKATKGAYATAQADGLAQAQALQLIFLEKAQQWFKAGSGGNS